MARSINWHKYKHCGIRHIDYISDLELVAYDLRGKLYPKINVADPTNKLPVGILADLSLYYGTRNYWGGGWWYRPQIFIEYDRYCFLVGKERLSSLPEHRRYERNNLWFTEADRNFVFEKVCGR